MKTWKYEIVQNGNLEYALKRTRPIWFGLRTQTQWFYTYMEYLSKNRVSFFSTVLSENHNTDHGVGHRRFWFGQKHFLEQDFTVWKETEETLRKHIAAEELRKLKQKQLITIENIEGE